METDTNKCLKRKMVESRASAARGYCFIIWTRSPQLTHSTADRFLYQSFSLWESGKWYLIFGSGTKLYVTDKDVVKPVVSVYPAASRAHLEGKTSLLCLASGMFPPLVQFSWKRPKKDGSLEELPSAEGEQLELRELGRTTSILLVHQPENSTYKYHCYVKHEWGTVEAQIQQVVPLDPLQPQCRVKLLCLLYTVLIVKSLVYCYGFFMVMILRN
ncbi:immunoglobulin lambda-like polypeptide 5 [Lates calcarifer]|uniref:immunoglobulin lambda-like polypeptide 5 n=1 Tax=Lates calcarifer TaxID=8187 RepID=UPI0021D7B736|nr:immunoglobulin lambda-like polypeptide 5 [Lates calcarifer]